MRKLRPEMKEAIQKFLLETLEQVFAGVEKEQPTEPVVELSFHAANDLVDLDAKLTLPLFWQ